MQEALSQPLQPVILPFETFLGRLFDALTQHGIRPCVARNYQGFPAQNNGNDIDLLILPAQLPQAMHALQSIGGVRIAISTERFYVANNYLAGASTTPGKRSIQVDFIRALPWIGLPILPIDAVLDAMQPLQKGNLRFYVPSPVHEALNSLLTSLIHGGWLKEKYFPLVQQTLSQNRMDSIAALVPQVGVQIATRLVDAVIREDRQAVIACIRPFRLALVGRCLLHHPFRSIRAVFQHYATEIALRYSPAMYADICVLGVDGSGKSKLIEALQPWLTFSAIMIRQRHFDQHQPTVPLPQPVVAAADSTPLAQQGFFRSIRLILAWLLSDWKHRIFGKAHFTLRLCERSYHDLLIDPRRYGYTGPAGLARFMAKCFPKPALWILLDRSSDKSDKAQAYRSFVQTAGRHLILDADQPGELLVEQAYTEIIDTLGQYTQNRLRQRY